MKWKTFILSAGMCVSVACVAAQYSDNVGAPKLSNAMIAEVEAQIKLPANAAPIDRYARYYSLDNTQGRKVLVGEYILNKKHPGIHMVSLNALPSGIMDGGCGVIDIEYDLVAKTVLRLSCHGVA